MSNIDLDVQKAQAGDAQAFARLITKSKKRIITLLEKYKIRDPEDIYQEGVFSAYKAIGQFKGNSSFETWLTQICINKGLNVMETVKRRGIMLSYNDIDSDDHTYPYDIRPDNDHPEAIVIAVDTVSRIQQTIASEKFLSLRTVYLEGKTYDETANLLNIPMGTVKSQIGRSKEFLREEFDCHI